VNASSGTQPLPKTERFSVDAAILRELGAKIVGRPHIALAELIKNAYDADARVCRVTFGRNSIEIADDGHGMAVDEFTGQWLRLGTKNKTTSGVSRKLGRNMTGSKGIGRFAVQFLADRLELASATRGRASLAVAARVDWDDIQEGELIASFPVRLHVPDVAPPAFVPGTTIRLQGLRDTWDAEALEKLGRELWLLRSPYEKGDDFRIELDAPDIADASQKFDRIQHALREDLWQARIRGRVSDGRQGKKAQLELQFVENYPPGASEQTISHTVSLPVADSESSVPAAERTSELDRVEFDIHVYRLSHKQALQVRLADLRSYLASFGGVSLYDASFRLPYYGINQDWLGIEAAHSARVSKSDLLPSRWDMAERYMLAIPTGRRLLGEVRVDTGHEERAATSAGSLVWLAVQPGRDRLLPNEAHRQLRLLIRYAIDFYANRFSARAIVDAKKGPPVPKPLDSLGEAKQTLDDHKEKLDKVTFAAIRKAVATAELGVKRERLERESVETLLAPLATAGMTALALTHELSREIESLRDDSRTLSRSPGSGTSPDLSAIAERIDEGTERLTRVQGLFTPLLDETNRKAKKRLKVRSVVDQVVQSMKPLMPRVDVELDIPSDLRFPPAPFVAWSALLQNLLANAWNAMLANGGQRIALHGKIGEECTLSVSDVGVGLDISPVEAVRFFEPFERGLDIPEDMESLAIGGYGMGLTISRMIVKQYDTSLRFVAPRKGFATTIVLRWKGRGPSK